MQAHLICHRASCQAVYTYNPWFEKATIEVMLQSGGGKTDKKKDATSFPMDEGQRPLIHNPPFLGRYHGALPYCPVSSRNS
jgi:hypothetical protein